MKIKLTPTVKALLGSFKPPKGFDYDYKKILKELKIKKFAEAHIAAPFAP